MRLRAATAGGLLVCSGVMAGCGVGGLQLGSRSVSACFQAIPAARSAVDDPGATLEGVHRIPAGAARHHLALHLVGVRRSGESVCAVALAGPFSAGQVHDAPLGMSGRYAIVLVTSGSLQVVGAFVTDRLPPAFGGRTF